MVFVPRSLQKPLKLREIGSKNVGRLVTVQVSLETEQYKHCIHAISLPHFDTDHAMWTKQLLHCCAIQRLETCADVLLNLLGS